MKYLLLLYFNSSMVIAPGYFHNIEKCLETRNTYIHHSPTGAASGIAADCLPVSNFDIHN